MLRAKRNAAEADPNLRPPAGRGGCLFWLGCLVFSLLMLAGAVALFGYAFIQIKNRYFPEEPALSLIHI